MKKTKFAIIGITTVCLLVCCKSNENQFYELDIPTFSSSSKINIGAWSWTNRGLSAAQLQGIEDAGMNVMVGTFNGSNNDSADGIMLNNAIGYDIGFILDKRNWDETAPVAQYCENDNFLGYCIMDEPNTSYVNYLKEKKEKWDESSLSDKMFYVNLNPSYSNNVGNDFDEYIRSYTEDAGLEMVSTDFYAMYEDEFEDCGVGIREDWLYDLSISAHHALNNDVPLWFTLLTTKHSASGLTYINPTARDLEYQMYVAMAFGTQYLLHYTYAATGSDHINPIVDSKGNPTDSYYDVKESSELIRKWDDFYMDFNWVGASGVYGTKSRNSLIDYLLYEVPLYETKAILAASSSQDVIIGQFEDENDNKGFVVTNLTNPYLEKTAKTLLKFDPTYKGVKIYQGGEESVSYLVNGAVELNIKPGEGVFVLPLKAKIN